MWRVSVELTKRIVIPMKPIYCSIGLVMITYVLGATRIVMIVQLYIPVEIAKSLLHVLKVC